MEIRTLIKRAFSQASKVQGMLQALYRGVGNLYTDEQVVEYLNEVLDQAKILEVDIQDVIDAVMKEIEEEE